MLKEEEISVIAEEFNLDRQTACFRRGYYLGIGLTFEQALVAMRTKIAKKEAKAAAGSKSVARRSTYYIKSSTGWKRTTIQTAIRDLQS